MAPFCASDSVLKFKPKAGSALFWFNHHPDLSVDSSTLHGSCPVKGNKKYIAQRW
jgi:prolyl 4-hydroxylase